MEILYTIAREIPSLVLMFLLVRYFIGYIKGRDKAMNHLFETLLPVMYRVEKQLDDLEEEGKKE